MYDSFGLFINGSWTTGAGIAVVLSRVSGRPLGAVATASAEKAGAALDAAAHTLGALREMGALGARMRCTGRPMRCCAAPTKPRA